MVPPVDAMPFPKRKEINPQVVSNLSYGEEKKLVAFVNSSELPPPVRIPLIQL